MIAVRQTRRFLASLGMVLCLALSAQMTVALLDRLQHVLDVDHAATALAGEIDYAHYHEHDFDHAHEHDFDHADDQDHQGPLPDPDAPLGHHHYGHGVLAPWLASVIYVLALPRVPQDAYSGQDFVRPDAAERRRDRPPKADLERVA